MIFFIHGFGSSSVNSGTAQAVKRLLPDAVLLDYNDLDPAESIEKIKQQILEHDQVTLIGISLGGFLARYLANECDNVTRLLMINPAINAHETLTKYEGTEFLGRQIPERFAYKYKPMRIRKDKPELEMFAYLGVLDDVIDPKLTESELKNRAQLTFADCGHRIVPNEKFQNWINTSINLVLG